MAKANKVRSLSSRDNVAMPYRPSKEDQERERRYRAEDDLRTLQRAQEIQKDRERMGMCKTVAREQMKGLQSVTGGGRSKRK